MTPRRHVNAANGTRRVAITGAGAVSALGTSASACWEAMCEGRSGIAPMSWAAASTTRPVLAARVADFYSGAFFDHRQCSLLDRVSQFALVAAREAVGQSGVDFSRAGLGERTAVVIGIGTGGETAREEQNERFYMTGGRKPHPLTIVRTMTNAPASHLSIEHGITGPAYAVSTACSSANYAIAQAFQMVATGQVDMALAGGTEACLTRGVVYSWEAMRVLADDACRPFSRDRRGLVLGEGAAMFVLEPFEHATRRNAPILGELAGAGLSSDALDIVSPSIDGVCAAMRRALATAGLSVEDVDYINAHGTGTALNDAVESAAIRAVFSHATDGLAVSSTKAMHGHALGASGAIELIAALGALRHGVIPPTINHVAHDPDCPIDCVPNIARERAVRTVLSNSFAFGGLNAVLALKAV